MTSSPPSDAEFSRKLALGILSMLHQKGLLSSDEVDAILYTARRQAESAPSAVQPAAPALTPLAARGPLSDPPRRGPLSDPPRAAKVPLARPAVLRDPVPDVVPGAAGFPVTLPSEIDETGLPKVGISKADVPATSAPQKDVPHPAAEVLPLDEDARTAEARWVRKEPLPPPTFDIEL